MFSFAKIDIQKRKILKLNQTQNHNYPNIRIVYLIVIILLEKRIEGLFVSNSSSWTMPWIDVIVWQGEELGLDAMKELLHATSRKVGSSDCFSEKSIPC